MSLVFEYMCMRLPFIPWFIAGVPSSQALPGFLIPAPPSVCVPAVIGALAVWIQKKKKRAKMFQDEWVCHKLGNTPVPRSGRGSWVLSS